jgi:hypothetical protein
VKIENNSSLKATCKIIMSPESRVIVKSGSNFIIEGADISSADHQTWNGIKVEGNGYGLILPDTKIDNGYFYMYTDNSILPNEKPSGDFEDNNLLLVNRSEVPQSSDVVIYPNPTGDYINIQTNETVKSVSIYDFEGKKISNLSKDPTKIDVQSLPIGSYILKIELNQKFITKKFIKQ